MKKTALFITLLFCGFDFAVAAETLPANGVQANTIKITTRPEILGLWGMDIPGNKKCVEYYNFRGSNEVVVNSGKEWSAGLYDYQPSPDNTLEKWPALVMQIKYENNEKDCSGFKEDQTGEMSNVFVRWENSNSIDFCADEKGDKCFVSLHRIRP